MNETLGAPLDQIENLDKYVEQGITMGMEYAPQLLLAIVTLIIGLWIINRITKAVGLGFEKGGVEPTLRKFILSLINIGLKALLVISVASMVGIETTSFVALLGAAGLAVGLALQGSLANFAGGVLILIFRPYKVGDFISGAGHMGSVKEISILHTILTTPDNKVIIIPNGAISNDSVINFSMMPTRRVDIVFGISYDDDLKKAKEVLTTLITNDERIHEEPAPMIVISELGDSSVNITTRSWVDAPNYWPVYFDLMENGKLELEAAGMTIPFPQRDVHIYQHTTNGSQGE